MKKSDDLYTVCAWSSIRQFWLYSVAKTWWTKSCIQVFVGQLIKKPTIYDASEVYIKSVIIYLFCIYNIRHEMHWQDPILVNNEIKGCRDIKNNTIQKLNNSK